MTLGSTIIFADNDLKLDMTNAELIFPDGRTSGNVHVQPMSPMQIPYVILDSASGPLLYNIQPMGILADGKINIELNLPKQNSSYEYLDYLTDYMLFTGLDPESMQIVPVGVGVIDKDTKKLISAIPLSIERLDYIGCAFVPASKVESVEQYINKEINIKQLISILQSI